MLSSVSWMSDKSFLFIVFKFIASANIAKSITLKISISFSLCLQDLPSTTIIFLSFRHTFNEYDLKFFFPNWVYEYSICSNMFFFSFLFLSLLLAYIQTEFIGNTWISNHDCPSFASHETTKLGLFAEIKRSSQFGGPSIIII